MHQLVNVNLIVGLQKNFNEENVSRNNNCPEGQGRLLRLGVC